MLIFSFPVKAVLFQGYSDLPARALPFLCAYLWASQITEHSCTECGAQEGSWKIIFMSVGLQLHVQCIILTVGKEVLLVTKTPQPVQSRHPTARLSLSRDGFFKKNNFLSFVLAVLCLCCCAGFSLVTVSRGCSSLRCTGFSLQSRLLLWAQALGVRASVAGARGLRSCGSWALEHRFSVCGTQA